MAKLDMVLAMDLSDDEFLFSLFTAIIKREGGEVRLTEEECIQVDANDKISLLYDINTKELILRASSELEE